MNKVILKADDFLSINNAERALEKYYRFLDIIEKNNVKCNVGIIGMGIERLSDKQLKNFKSLIGKKVELFNHTYRHVMPDNVKFFREKATQIENIVSCNKTIEKIFGIKCETLGAAANFIPKTFLDALIEDMPEIKTMFIMRESDAYPFLYGKKNLIEINGYRELENKIDRSWIQWNNFISKYQKFFDGVKVYQLHPSYWCEGDLKLFERILKIMIDDGKQFVFASEI